MKAIITILLALVTFNISLAQNDTFDNPLAEKRADPWVFKTDEGVYYLIATVPEYNQIVLRQSQTINGLKTAEEKVIWTKHKTGDMGNHIWAPELHKVNGKWYIYFAAAPAEDLWKIRMWALSTDHKDPMKGKWKEEGQIKTKNDSFSLDATSFEHNDKRYLIWAQRVGDGTALILSEMLNPTTLTGPEVILTRPEFSWERVKYNVNEGPAVIKKNGKIFVTFSASATNHNYCVGLLWADDKADLLNENNWQKSPSPVFYTNADVKRYGPGHNSFTTSENGEDIIMIYHARDYKDIIGHELSDPNRATRARVVNWTPSGFPDFMQYIGD
ncbi:alpha-N-arabinofuranosidase [Tamlana nanhaiensis]|uniref:Alpha-N-arabinofuranosidase n=1 Tax=Neotamlana nanhaiensis TaxID=1382798 RepID=A0A0D7W0A4_9FLAO|nr:family 43 glycosylhydrolase [Tamlana nanhaiensis]KJD32138.1 alpha-N-arabinofuranosidase [Tamlana nanhaiensis]KJD32300.1 alpha-N-arabinofuranosidase [Tamlana nanhaiensis]